MEIIDNYFQKSKIMKKIYLKPETISLKIEYKQMIAQSSFNLNGQTVTSTQVLSRKDKFGDWEEEEEEEEPQSSIWDYDDE